MFGLTPEFCKLRSGRVKEIRMVPPYRPMLWGFEAGGGKHVWNRTNWYRLVSSKCLDT